MVNSFDISLFYGITTTTLIVLSSVTWVIFQWFLTNLTTKIKNTQLLLTQSITEVVTCNKEVRLVIGAQHKRIHKDIQTLSKSIVLEQYLLIGILLLASLSVVLVLISGVFDLNLSIKIILSINLMATVIYIVALLSLIFRASNRHKLAIKLQIEINALISNIKEIMELKQ